MTLNHKQPPLVEELDPRQALATKSEDLSAPLKETAESETPVSDKYFPDKGSEDKTPLLIVKNLYKFYYDKSSFFRKNMVVDKVSFDVQRGEIFGITGNNSCGKSTIADILSGAIKPDAGKIVFDGKKLHYGDYHFRREHIRLANLKLVETFNLPIDVYEFLNITLEVIGIDREFRNEIIKKTLSLVHAPKNLANKRLDKLNMQEQSLVSLSHALILKPDIIIVDDLFATVDLSFKGVLINILLDLQQSGTTIILITSDLGIIKHMCDRVLILQDGVTEDLGPTYDVLLFSESEFTKRLVKSYFGKSLTSASWVYPI